MMGGGDGDGDGDDGGLKDEGSKGGYGWSTQEWAQSDAV